MTPKSRTAKKTGEHTAQAVHFVGGKAIPGKKFTPIYADWTRRWGKDQRVRQKLELYMLTNPGMVPSKELASESSMSKKEVEDVVRYIAKTHDLPSRIHGSKMPIKAQDAIKAIYENAKHGEKIQLLRVIYTAYKATRGVVISFSSAEHILRHLEAHAREPKKIAIGYWNMPIYKSIDAFREKMKQLEQMEREGKLPWQHGK